MAHPALALLLLAHLAMPAVALPQACDDAHPCDLGSDRCITNVRCKDGQCAFDPVNCDDGNPCTINDRCDPVIGCVNEPKCPSDGLICDGKEECCDTQQCLQDGIYGQCVTSELSCDDGDPCTCDSCSEAAGGCQHVPRNCEDGDSCTIDRCDPSATDNCEPGRGCLHDAITDCCRSNIDCQDACKVGRLCEEKVCTAGTPASCDDGDPLTVDACDPAVGCTHTSTLPGPMCHVDADCPADPDPCRIASCDLRGACTSVPIKGLASVACVCRRADPSSCAGIALPRSVTAKRNRACALIAKAAIKTTKARTLVRRARKLLVGAGRRLAKAKRVSPACQRDAGNLFSDGANRAGALEL